MQERYLLVSGKTLTDLLKMLNNPDLEYGRVVYVEKTRSGYTAMIDTHSLVVYVINTEEEARREHNRAVLMNLDMETANVV